MGEESKEDQIRFTIWTIGEMENATFDCQSRRRSITRRIRNAIDCSIPTNLHGVECTCQSYSVSIQFDQSSFESHRSSFLIISRTFESDRSSFLFSTVDHISHFCYRYRILAVSSKSGFIEPVPNSLSLDKLKKQHTNLLNFFIQVKLFVICDLIN